MKEITLVCKFVVSDAKDPDKICSGCVLKVGMHLCANRSLCPDKGDGKNLQWADKPTAQREAAKVVRRKP